MAKIREDDIDLLRDKADLVEVVSAHTHLKKAGGHTYKGLCPFHSEKTPSFTVDTAKGLFHCLAGETGVMTWQGTVPIEKLAGDTHRLLTTGGKWVEAEIKSFGVQKLWKIELSRNRVKKTIFATDGHRWFVRGSGGKRKELVTTDLRRGHRLESVVGRSGVAYLRTAPAAFGVAQGFTFGDGHRNGKYGTRAFFDGNKDTDLLEYFPGSTVCNSGDRLNIGQLPNFFKELPSLDEAPGYLYGWLAGYFAADGCVSTDGQVILSCADREHLEFVRTLANRLGIGTYGIKHQRRKGFPDRLESDLFHVTFMSSTLTPEFFVLGKHRTRFEATIDRASRERRGWAVVSVVPTPREEEVYCAVVPGTHAFVLEDNILTGNCFGCSKGGNVYQFVQEIESLPFPEAVEWIARRFNYELRYEDQTPGQARAYGMKRRLADANKAAAEYFHKALMESPDAEPARAYLSGRGFGKEVAERWQLGYAPGRNSLCKHLLGLGFTQEEIVKADLGRISERDGALFDSFRQRIIFPTWSLQDDVVAFGARAMGDQQPKYLNTGETPLFSKSRFMYGLNRAKSSIARSHAIVVEGYTDVIALHEAGITQAVATNGTALGETHFELLKKFSSRAVLMFDSDSAGQAATERGFGLHHRIGLEVLVAPLPPGRDPADVVAQEGAEGISKVIDAGQPLLEFKLEQTISKLALDTPEARSKAVREAVQVLGWLPDPIARHEYAFMVARRIGVQPEAVQRALTDRRSGPPAAYGGTSKDRERRLLGHVKVEREALQLLLTDNERVTSYLHDINEGDFTSPARRELFREARSSMTGQHASGIAEHLSPDALALYTELVVEREPAPAEEDPEGAVREVFGRLKVFSLEREIKRRRDTLQELNPLEEAERHDALFTELVGLEARRRDLLRTLQGVS